MYSKFTYLPNLRGFSDEVKILKLLVPGAPMFLVLFGKGAKTITTKLDKVKVFTKLQWKQKRPNSVQISVYSMSVCVCVYELFLLQLKQHQIQNSSWSNMSEVSEAEI